MAESPIEADPVARLAAALRERGATDSVSESGMEVLRRAAEEARRVVRWLRPDAAGPDVEDLVHDVLELGWRRLADLPDPGGENFWAWVRQTTRYVVANDGRRRRELLTWDGVLEHGEVVHGVLAALEREERDAVVFEAIAASLEGIEQDVLYHRYVHGYSRQRIAALLGLPDANAVRVILQRAQRRLKVELERRLEELGRGPSFARSIDPT